MKRKQVGDLSARTWLNVQGIHERMVRSQKLTRNLFLTLHGHNVHRQQRQLSKFLMRYQQFTSHAYCGAAGPLFKIASQQEKAFVLRCPDLWLQYSVSFMHGLEKTRMAVSLRSELLVAHEKLGQLPLLTVYVVPV
jgi:hypothetical protein